MERMEEHGVPVRRVINAGGIPQRSTTLNRVYANVLGKPILVAESDATSLGSAIFAFLAAGTFPTIEEAQDALCPSYRVFEPDASESATADRLYRCFGRHTSGSDGRESTDLSGILPELRSIAARGAEGRSRA